ncbi:hypothetical protein MATL_G00204600 [Megalops atlanticus]|uniref:Selenoprotein L n=1 Tax=Megalops atlanticus TaxID=7932 RepID=A0A9D3PI76_MEGAT|nr:hypothetical protein MATL_G00204600 [Megalops atlanticus]
MDGAVTPQEDDILINALKDLVHVVQGLLENAEKESSKGSLEEFVSTKLGSLFGLIPAGAKFLNSLSVKRRSEAEDVWKNAYHRAEVRDLVEDLMQLGEKWDAFLERLDEELQMSDRLLANSPQAVCLSGEMVLTDARSGEIANQGLLDAQSLRVLVVSSGCQEGADYWLQDTGCKYDMLLDPEKKIYSAFGLGASYAKVLKFNTMLEYGEYTVQQRTFPQAQPNIIKDIYQLGGDFVLDEGGKVIYSHPSKSPRDRPAVSEILAAIVEGSHSSTP